MGSGPALHCLKVGKRLIPAAKASPCSQTLRHPRDSDRDGRGARWGQAGQVGPDSGWATRSAQSLSWGRVSREPVGGLSPGRLRAPGSRCITPPSGALSFPPLFDGGCGRGRCRSAQTPLVFSAAGGAPVSTFPLATGRPHNGHEPVCQSNQAGTPRGWARSAAPPNNGGVALLGKQPHKHQQKRKHTFLRSLQQGVLFSHLKPSVHLSCCRASSLAGRPCPPREPEQKPQEVLSAPGRGGPARRGTAACTSRPRARTRSTSWDARQPGQRPWSQRGPAQRKGCQSKQPGVPAPLDTAHPPGHFWQWTSPELSLRLPPWSWRW